MTQTATIPTRHPETGKKAKKNKKGKHKTKTAVVAALPAVQPPVTLPGGMNPSAKVINFPKGGRRRTTAGLKFPPNAILAEDINLILGAIKPRGPQRVQQLSADRLRALVCVLYRSGLRISEALDLVEADLIRNDGVINVRRGKGDKQRLAAMDPWGWRELDRWLAVRKKEIPAGYVFPILRGVDAGKRWADCDVRRQLHHIEREARLGKRLAPHQLRHGHATELRREGVDLYAISRQLGHANLTVTSIYFRGIDPLSLIEPITVRKPPMVSIEQEVS